MFTPTGLYNETLDLVTKNLRYIVPLITIILIPIAIFHWRRRWLYYYAAKLPGPFSIPLIGSTYILSGPQGIHKFLRDLYDKYPSVVRIWLGPFLYVSTTEPAYLKTILTQCLDKGEFYHLMGEYFHRALAAAPVEWWRRSRKNINPTFNVGLIGTFVDSFNKQAKVLVKDLDEMCGKETGDIFPRVWRCTLDAGCETLAQVDPAPLKSDEFLPTVFRIEEILLQRFFNPVLHLDPFWKLSPHRKELLNLWRRNCSFIQKMIDLMKPSEATEQEDFENSNTKKRFLNHLVDLNQNKEIPHDYMLEEAQIMLFVGTETSGVALSSTLLVLGMYPEIQDKIDEELKSIFGNSDRDPTLEDVNKMEYLERVIKETLRLLPPIPFVMRTMEKNVELGPHVFPAGANIIVPIAAVHRRKEFWPDPLKFNPDRFLPEEVEKRPPCSFIPFSYGVRNCIGYRYGLLSMKVILSTVLRNFRVKSSNYKSIEDMDLIIHVVAKPKKGYKIVLERK